MTIALNYDFSHAEDFIDIPLKNKHSDAELVSSSVKHEVMKNSSDEKCTEIENSDKNLPATDHSTVLLANNLENNIVDKQSNMAPKMNSELAESGGTCESTNTADAKFRLEIRPEPAANKDEDPEDGGVELTMDYPSLCPLDAREIKARRRELEAKKFQEELDRMAVQLADRLKRIPASSRRTYKKESIYVKDLYTLTYEDGETLESLDFFQRRNDREEIRRRLAMGAEEEMEEPADHRKLSLQTRLQTGMNLQICFMNETASDCESQCSDTESAQDHRIDYPKSTKGANKGPACVDFASRQTQLQAEARLALSQAKDMARMQMEVDRQKRRCSPVTAIIRDSFCKIGMTFPDNKRRLSRQLLTDMNVAQLQVIVNHLHTQIEGLNEELVQHLLSRDDLHMEQDSRLVDIEDLSNHLAAKERSNSTTSSGSKSSPTSSSCLSTPSSASRSPPSTSTSVPSPPQSATGLSSASPTSPLSSGEAERLRLAFAGPAVASK